MQIGETSDMSYLKVLCICLYENSLQIPGLTSLPSTLTAKKSMKMKFSANKIYYNLFQENPKITNI